MIPDLLGRFPFTRPLVRALALWRVGGIVRRSHATLESRDGVLRVRRGDRTIILSEAHLPFAPEMAKAFDGYFSAVGPTGDPSVRDYSRPANHPIPALGVPFWLAGPTESIGLLDAYFAEGAPQIGDTVFDLGANSGLATWLLARAVGATGTVHAFEPDPGNREMLSRNVAQHGLVQVRIHSDAIAGTSGVRQFNAESSLGAAFSDIVHRAGLARTIDVRTVTLEQAAHEAGAVPTFIKMDVEGAEVEILEQARPWLREHRPMLVVDTQHRVGGRFTDTAVEALLRECQYTVHTSMVQEMRLTIARASGGPRRPAAE
jgi:FkbM family methyltransferase